MTEEGKRYRGRPIRETCKNGHPHDEANGHWKDQSTAEKMRRRWICTTCQAERRVSSRGGRPAATTCKNGHPCDDANGHWVERETSGGKRRRWVCHTCNIAAVRAKGGIGQEYTCRNGHPKTEEHGHKNIHGHWVCETCRQEREAGQEMGYELAARIRDMTPEEQARWREEQREARYRKALVVHNRLVERAYFSQPESATCDWPEAWKREHEAPRPTRERQLEAFAGFTILEEDGVPVTPEVQAEYDAKAREMFGGKERNDAPPGV